MSEWSGRLNYLDSEEAIVDWDMPDQGPYLHQQLVQLRLAILEMDWLLQQLVPGYTELRNDGPQG